MQENLSESVDLERRLMSDVFCKKEDKNKYLEENSSTERKLERQKPLYPDAYDFRRKGVFACLVCFRKFISCSKVKKHFIREHPKAFCALGHENTEEPKIQAKLLMFCPKDCQYVTLKVHAFTHHLATCLEPDLSSQENVENQLELMAENGDENDGRDRQVKSMHLLASKSEQSTDVARQGNESVLNPFGKVKEIHTCMRCNAKFSTSGSLECHMKLYHGEKSGKVMHSQKNLFPSSPQGKYQNVKKLLVRSRCLAKSNKTGSSYDHGVPSCSRNDGVHKTFNEGGLLKQSSQLPLRPNVPNTSTSSISTRRQIHSRGRFTCRKCFKNFDKIQDFHMHMVMHEREKHANGIANGKIRDEKDQLTAMAKCMVSSEGNKIKTVNSQCLALDRIAEFECVKCKKCFPENSALILHMKSHRRKLHQCHECNKVFKRSHCLRMHMRTHTGEKPCKCEECGVYFRTRGTLRMHLKRHRGDRPFQCSICGNSFGARSTLETHLRTHTGEKPYQCAECGKSFSQSGSLNLHMKIHSGEKPFECEICGRAFKIRVILRKHMLTHTREKPHKCSECGREFSNGICFKWHLKSHQKKSR